MVLYLKEPEYPSLMDTCINWHSSSGEEDESKMLLITKMMTHKRHFFYQKSDINSSGTCKLTDFAMYPLSVL